MVNATSTADAGFGIDLWPDMWPLFAVMALLIPLSVLQIYAERWIQRQRRARVVQVPLDDKLQRVQELSRELSALNTEVQAQCELQIAATEQAKSDAEHAVALASLNAEQHQAATRLVETQVGNAFNKNNKSERWFQVGLSFFWFVAGVVVTVVVT